MRKIFLLSIATLLLFSGEVFGELTKQEQWQQLAQEVDTWTDGMGLPIDSEIKETVIVLNLLGIVTSQSCEGHLDWGLCHPWVDFDKKIDEVESIALSALQKKTDAMYRSIEMNYPDITWPERFQLPEGQELIPFLEERNALYSKHEKLKQTQAETLYLLLEQFYENRTTSYDRMLILNFPTRDSFRIQSNGATRQIIRSESQREEKLAEYQDEMAQFTTFLKQLFFNNP